MKKEIDSLNKNNLSYDELIKILDEIKKECNKKLQPRDRARYFIIINEIPYTMNGKVDYKKLTEYATSKISELNDDEERKSEFYIVDTPIIKHSKKRTLKK